MVPRHIHSAIECLRMSWRWCYNGPHVQQPKCRSTPITSRQCIQILHSTLPICRLQAFTTCFAWRSLDDFICRSLHPWPLNAPHARQKLSLARFTTRFHAGTSPYWSTNRTQTTSTAKWNQSCIITIWQWCLVEMLGCNRTLNLHGFAISIRYWWLVLANPLGQTPQILLSESENNRTPSFTLRNKTPAENCLKTTNQKKRLDRNKLSGK